MALVACKECEAQISSEAKACPQCGAAPPKKTSMTTWIIGGLLAVGIGSSILNSNSSDAPVSSAASARTPEQLKADREINTVIAGARALRESMKKPETFELISATMMDGKAICYEYRARNSFNDRRTEYYVVTDTVSNGKPETWNKHCAGKQGTDYSHARAVL